VSVRSWWPADTAARVRRARLAVLLTAVGALAIACLASAGLRAEAAFVLDLLASGDATAVQEYILSYGYWAPVISLALMVVQALAAPVPSFVITFANGLAFGVFWGWVLSVAVHALAACVCFWIARAVGRGPVEGLVGRVGLEAVDRWFTRKGVYAIFVARLLPGVGFDAVSYAAGLSGLRFGRFISATTLGIIPQTLLYAYLGQNATQYLWMLLVANGVIVGSVTLAGLVAHRRCSRARSVAPGSAGGQRQLPTSAVQ
jgi:uncharacterized membrane protein YdjX (TVP38/TMEM64 family)